MHPVRAFGADALFLFFGVGAEATLELACGTASLVEQLKNGSSAQPIEAFSEGKDIPLLHKQAWFRAINKDIVTRRGTDLRVRTAIYLYRLHMSNGNRHTS